MKNYKSLIFLGLISFCLTACGEKTPKEVNFTLNELSANIDIHTDEQKAYLHASDPNAYVDEHSSELANASKSAPKGVKFSWEYKSDNGAKPKDFTLSFKEKSSGDVYSVNVESSPATVYNFKLGEEYSWNVSANYKGASFKSEDSSFSISGADPIRNIYIEGLENVRDCGGWTLANNKTYKQGMLYRTCEFNSAKTNPFASLTDNGKNVLLNQLKIKSEIDLRKTLESNNDDEVNGITSSPLGETINYISCPMVFSQSNIYTRSENKDSLKRFFESLAVESNYPIAFHCVRGTDRTGGLAYVLGALLGMDETDLMRDYLFSNFANIKSNPIKAGNIDRNSFYIVGMSKCEGDTPMERARNYLIENTGVSGETLDTIVSILTE